MSVHEKRVDQCDDPFWLFCCLDINSNCFVGIVFPFFLNFKYIKIKKLCNLILSFFLNREKGVLREFFLRLDFVNSLVAPVKADPERAPFTALKYKKLERLISAREVDLPISLKLTDSVKH